MRVPWATESQERGYGIGPAAHPYHRFGTGKPLLVIPGVMDPLGWNEPSWAALELLRRYQFAALDNRAVWVVSRPPGLDGAASPERLAEGYAAVLETIGPADVFGLSFGGFIGMELARKRRALIDRLVLCASGPRYGEYGRATLRRWEQLGEGGAWSAIHLDYARTVYAGYRRLVVPPLYRVGARFLPDPVVAADVPTTLRAARAYDGTETLEALSVPTLAIGGAQDVLVPYSIVEAAAAGVEHCSTVQLSGGHAIYEERRTAVGERVSDFLTGGSGW